MWNMRKSKLTYNQAIDLVIAHMRATNNWFITTDMNIRRKNYIPGRITDLFSKHREILEENCCPISSLNSVSADYFQSCAKSLGIPKEAVHDLITAADNLENINKKQRNIRRRMLRAAGL